ncbi:Pro-Pol polyprotein [Labeo rohita]|uniref:Pro-Pol polyprotein n=1 Tax=Labeo rohita TaxID=84645 RepID=A0ABQ8L549_LABRO|nr:Pro-Pol polyprotein [Labeo rohita]
MYHQVKIPPENVDFLRFLWWKDGDVSQPLLEYRMLVYLFGATSSSRCASYALRRTAEDNKNNFSAEAVSTVMNHFYVDDLLKSVSTPAHAIRLYQELKALCATGGFNLTKWSSNSREVLAHIPEPERAKEMKDLDLDLEDLPVERALGVQWCAEEDVFKFHVSLKDQPCTRRGILSMVSSMYDPLGFLAPLTFPAKQILQELCRLKLGWDEVIPDTHAQSWKQWRHGLKTLIDFNITRCFKPKNFGNLECAKMHHFCDASESGYGTVTYLRLTNSRDQVHIAFVMGKSRVAPLKLMTIPRLELTAAVLAVRVDRMLSTELQLQLEPPVFWTDSTTVLKYIRNDSRRFHTFVVNRVDLIRNASDVFQWKHIPGKMNPANCASRGLNVAQFLKNNIWINGPKFLRDLPQCWPNPPPEFAIPSDDPELRREVVEVHATFTSDCNATSTLLNYISTWSKLRNAVAWMLKLKNLLVQHVLKGKDTIKTLKPGCMMLSIQDIEDAEESIVKFCQNQGFPREMDSLCNGKNIDKKSSILRLDPIIDNGILRVGGRLKRMAMPEEQKHPAILPKQHHVSKLLLRHIHHQTGHSGRNHMLSTLRKKYWIPCANSLARKIINECVPCRRQHACAGEQKMADLPIDRLTPDLPPFSHVGVDYFGPIEVRRGRSTVKRYGVMFTCLTSRAVHLEVAHTLDTDSCVNAFRRFISRRGQVKELRSDNGTNLIAAEKELKEALKSWNVEQIECSLLQKGVKWTFNPPAGAHHGGVWERLIRIVKRILLSVTNQQHLDDEGLATVMCEVESILNSCPLTTLSDDPNDLEPLTPNHLLQLKVQPVLPPGLFKKEDLYVRRRWRQIQYIADLFWTRWIREFLPLMQERQKWSRVKQNFSVGDIVVVADATAPRGSWIMARVIEAMKDSKGLVRSVRLQTKTNQLQRPINKICLLVEAASQD